MNDYNFYDLKGYPEIKIIKVSENQQIDNNSNEIYCGLKNIENKYNIDIIKFTNFKYRNKYNYIYNYIGSSGLKIQKYFNKNINLKVERKQLKGDKLAGFYFFSDYNKSIEKDLISLGLSISDFEKPNILIRICNTILECYFQVIFFTLIIYCLLKIITNKTFNFSFLFEKNKKIYVVLLTVLNFFFIDILWVYNKCSNFFEFVRYYLFLGVTLITLFILLDYIFYKFFKKNKISILLNKLDTQLYLFGKSIGLLLLYFVIINFTTVSEELYLQYLNNPLKSVENMTTADLSSFTPQSINGGENTNNYYIKYLNSQSDVIISAYNVGYQYSENNYDPYSGNSFLTSPKYFETQKVLDYKDNVFLFDNKRKNNEVDLIIPFHLKNNQSKIIYKYKMWMSFISDIPVEKLNIQIHYSKDNQHVYSYGYQNSILALKMNSPVIMVVKPEALNGDEIVSLLSNRFISYNNIQKYKNDNGLSRYFIEINKIKNLMSEESYSLLVSWLILLISIFLLLNLFIFEVYEKVEILDELIWYIFSLTIIILFFNFRKFPFMIISCLIIYTLFRNRNRNNKRALD